MKPTFCQESRKNNVTVFLEFSVLSFAIPNVRVNDALHRIMKNKNKIGKTLI